MTELIFDPEFREAITNVFVMTCIAAIPLTLIAIVLGVLSD